VDTHVIDRPIELDLQLPAGAVAPAYARALVAGLRDRVADDLLEDVVLLVSEVVTNCVRHAELGPGEAIQLRLRASRTSVRLDVTDPGPGFDPGPVTAHDPTSPGGWGLYIVDQLADRWGVARDAGTRVWFEIDAGPGGHRTAWFAHERWSGGEAASA
jgi:anti-sigma regulatory factor (Ser/Thr protein kinase)